MAFPQQGRLSLHRSYLHIKRQELLQELFHAIAPKES